MGFFSWTCAATGISIKAANTGAAREQSEVVFLGSDGTRNIGIYDGYGRIDSFEITNLMSGDSPGKLVLKAVYSSTLHTYDSLGQSDSARDQGFFYNGAFADQAFYLITNNHVDASGLKKHEDMFENLNREGLSFLFNEYIGEPYPFDGLSYFQVLIDSKHTNAEENALPYALNLKMYEEHIRPRLKPMYKELNPAMFGAGMSFMTNMIERLAVNAVCESWEEKTPLKEMNWDSLLGFATR